MLTRLKEDLSLEPTDMEPLNLPADGSPTQWRRTKARRLMFFSKRDLKPTDMEL